LADRPRQQQQERLLTPAAGGDRRKTFWPRRAAWFPAGALALLLTAGIPAATAVSSEPVLPFKPGERVTYDISWMGVVGGEGILEVMEQATYEDSPVYVVRTIGRSVGFVRDLYRVEDHTSSLFDIDHLYSRKVEVTISEGAYRKHKIIEFDHDGGLARYVVNNKEPEVFQIDTGSQDSFSALYKLRTMSKELKVGASVFIPVFEDKKKYRLEVKVLRKERVTLPQGMLDTIVVEPQLKTEGIFQRRGKMTLWLADNESLVPVIVRSKVLIGSFLATIRDYRGVSLEFIPVETVPAR